MELKTAGQARPAPQRTAKVQTKLTVCMPTYNRGDLLQTLILTILPTLRSIFGAAFEIVVSENHSKDDTFERVDKLSRNNPEIRLVQPPVHYPTAEENLHFALGQCGGEYVWILGDDDSVEPSAVLTLRDYIDRAEHDLIIFNSRSHSFTGQVLKDVRIPCLAPALHIPLLDFVRLTGFWFVISGFSTTVFRRSALDLDLFRQIMDIGKIYSQVTWLIGQFHDKPFAFVNKPLVAYRQNLSDVQSTGHWEHVAKRERLFPRAIWTNGFLQQLDFLVARGVFDRAFVAEVVDRNLNNRFYFIDEMFMHMINTTIEWLDKKMQPIPPAECYYFTEWMRVLWPTNICFVSAMEKLYESVFEDVSFDRKQLDIAAGVINARIKMPWYQHFHRYDAYGFSIFEHTGRWFAIRQGSEPQVKAWLEYLDFTDLDDVLVVRFSEYDLLTQLASMPPRLDKAIPADMLKLVQAAPQSAQSGQGDEIAALQGEAASLRNEAATLRNEVAAARRDHSVEGSELKRQIQMLRDQLQMHVVREGDLERQIVALRNSTSWKITAPIRGLAGRRKSPQ